MRRVSVLFADLEGFTSYSERVGPEAVDAMLAEYFADGVPRRPPRRREVKLIGDAVMATFNQRGDQPDHALRATRAGLAFQEAAGRVASRHPDWPRFRVGVNTGDARVGVTGAAGGREYTAVGDTVNLASRLRRPGRAGQVVVGGETYAGLPDGTTVEWLTSLYVKGKEGPVDACVVVALPGGDGEDRGQGLEREHEESERDRR